MLISPDVILAAVDILKRRLDIIDCYRRNSLHCVLRIVRKDIGKSQVSDRAIRVLKRFLELRGVVVLHRLTGFLCSAKRILVEGCAGSGSLRAKDKRDVLIRASDILPVGCLSGEDRDELVRCQALDAAVCHILGDNDCHADCADLMVNQLCCLVFIELLLSEYVRIADSRSSI